MPFMKNVILSTVIFSSFIMSGLKVDVTQRGLQAPSLLLIDDARSQFRLGNQGEAVKDLLAAASLIRIEATSYGPPMRQQVEAVAADITKLSETVHQGTIKATSVLDQSLSAIIFRKADLHAKEAEKIWALKDVKRAGYEILATAHAMEHGAEWSGSKISSSTERLLQDAKKSATKMIDEGTSEKSEVENILKSLTSEFTPYRPQLKSSKSDAH